MFDCVLIDDQAYCEQKRLEIMNAKGPAKFKLEFRIIRQNTGAIHKQRVLVQRVEDEMGNLIGLRGAEMIVEQIKPNVAIVTDVCHDTGTPMLDKIPPYMT